MSIKKYKFYKNSLLEWYVHLPEYTGPIEDLQMVAGADNLLDILAQGEDVVYMNISLEPFENCNKLELVDATIEIGGGTYLLHKYNGVEFDMTIWLCKVTEFVFGFLPKTIYFT